MNSGDDCLCVQKEHRFAVLLLHFLLISTFKCSRVFDRANSPRTGEIDHEM